MHPNNQHIVITGAAHGIGQGLSRRFAAEGAKKIALIDLDEAAVQAVASDIGARAYAVDVADADAFAHTLRTIESDLGHIDLFCSNAGVGYADGEHVAAASDALWEKTWRINVHAHVVAARELLPAMLKRQQGHFLITASAAGLLSQIGSASYSTSKHAAVGFAESLAIMHGDQGIGVSLLCPQGVDTRMMAAVAGGGPQGADGIMPIETLCDAVMQGLDAETFLILPHPQVGDYMQFKVANYDKWLGGMRKLRDQFA
ncbi:MAG: SDR family NAD(P)-dependent oxidoreductase [Pseudomonadota bacterium]